MPPPPLPPQHQRPQSDEVTTETWSRGSEPHEERQQGGDRRHDKNDREKLSEAETGAGAKERPRRSRNSPPRGAASSGVAPLLREDFRSTLLSGLLLHLCPPPGQFADLFGLDEGLRERILALLSVRDLVTFGLVSAWFHVQEAGAGGNLVTPWLARGSFWSFTG